MRHELLHGGMPRRRLWRRPTSKARPPGARGCARRGGKRSGRDFRGGELGWGRRGGPGGEAEAEGPGVSRGREGGQRRTQRQRGRGGQTERRKRTGLALVETRREWVRLVENRSMVRGALAKGREAPWESGRWGERMEGTWETRTSSARCEGTTGPNCLSAELLGLTPWVLSPRELEQLWRMRRTKGHLKRSKRRRRRRRSRRKRRHNNSGARDAE
ncbi:unnamed protein product [Prorocentrum cordatum]|uniref:Uncharacterized protein n=1 Tax=Prorocentrum cordatum TaxID=2364126 RepID=A0ABN9YDS2_9DINO|nr:unnamed protein product [Polarella glacialis]